MQRHLYWRMLTRRHFIKLLPFPKRLIWVPETVSFTMGREKDKVKSGKNSGERNWLQKDANDEFLVRNNLLAILVRIILRRILVRKTLSSNKQTISLKPDFSEPANSDITPETIFSRCLSCIEVDSIFDTRISAFENKSIFFLLQIKNFRKMLTSNLASSP